MDNIELLIINKANKWFIKRNLNVVNNKYRKYKVR